MKYKWINLELIAASYELYTKFWVKNSFDNVVRIGFFFVSSVTARERTDPT